MESTDQTEPTETQRLAERLLSEQWGSTVRLEQPQPLGGSDRSHVVRYRVAESAAVSAPATVVVKHAVVSGREKYDPDAPDGPAARLFNDWAGLQFLTECFDNAADMPTPRFLAGNRADGLIVMGDIGTGKGLDHYLLADDPDAAAQCMTALMAALGRMHAVTCGRQARYDAIRDALGPREAPVSVDAHASQDFDRLAKGLARFDITLTPDFRDTLADFAQVFYGDGPFRVYSHNDPCPDNVLWIEGRMTLLDFEFSGMANAAIDMCYPRAVWPTCWCANRTPPALIEAVEQAYRRELVAGCPAATADRLFYGQLAAGCAHAAFQNLDNYYVNWCLDKGVKLGSFNPIQQLLARLDGFAGVSEQHDQFPKLGALARETAAAVRAQMPDDFREMLVYMAFRKPERYAG